MRQARMLTLGIWTVLVIAMACSKSATGPVPTPLAGTWNLTGSNVLVGPQSATLSPFTISITATTSGGVVTYGATWTAVTLTWSGGQFQFVDSIGGGSLFNISGDSLFFLANRQGYDRTYCALRLFGTIQAGSAQGVVDGTGSNCNGLITGAWSAKQQ